MRVGVDAREPLEWREHSKYLPFFFFNLSSFCKDFLSRRTSFWKTQPYLPQNSNYKILKTFQTIRIFYDATKGKFLKFLLIPFEDADTGGIKNSKPADAEIGAEIFEKWERTKAKYRAEFFERKRRCENANDGDERKFQFTRCNSVRTVSLSSVVRQYLW